MSLVAEQEGKGTLHFPSGDLEFSRLPEASVGSPSGPLAFTRPLLPSSLAAVSPTPLTSGQSLQHVHCP